MFKKSQEIKIKLNQVCRKDSSRPIGELRVRKLGLVARLGPRQGLRARHVADDAGKNRLNRLTLEAS